MRELYCVELVNLEVRFDRPSTCLRQLLVFHLNEGGVPSGAIWTDRIVREGYRVELVNLRVRFDRPSICFRYFPMFCFNKERVVGVVV